jgi:menaquinone-dependent protoporphyrinogen oxidase
MTKERFFIQRPGGLFCILIVLTVLLCCPVRGFAWREKPEEVIEKTCGDNNTDGKKILIAYDTEHGATATITDRIADVLCRNGFQVDLRMANNVADIEQYDAVVAGSPIYEFKWLPYTQCFLMKNKRALAQKPLALFITCTYLKDENDTPERRAKAIELYFDPILKKLPGIEPVSYGILSGEFTYSELYPRESFRMRLARFEEGDFRNWDKIEAWAEELSVLLQ